MGVIDLTNDSTSSSSDTEYFHDLVFSPVKPKIEGVLFMTLSKSFQMLKRMIIMILLPVCTSSSSAGARTKCHSVIHVDAWKDTG